MITHWPPYYWILVQLLISIKPHKCLNTWKKETGSNGEDIWRSTSDFIPVQSTSFGTIRISHIMSAEFDFIWKGRTNYPRANYRENFFRIGHSSNNGKSCNGQGSNYPSFWLSANMDIMDISVTSGTMCQPFVSLTDYQLIIDISYHIKIFFNQSHVIVDASNGSESNMTKIWTREPTQNIFIDNDVPVWWMSNKYTGTAYNVGNATFSNIVIISTSPSAPNNVTIFPTPFPTVTPHTSDLLVTDIIKDEDSVKSNGDFQLDTDLLIAIIVMIIGALMCVFGIRIMYKNRRFRKDIEALRGMDMKRMNVVEVDGVQGNISNVSVSDENYQLEHRESEPGKQKLTLEMIDGEHIVETAGEVHNYETNVAKSYDIMGDKNVEMDGLKSISNDEEIFGDDETPALIQDDNEDIRTVM
eukprot:235604_1